MEDRIPRGLQHCHETCCEKDGCYGRRACMVQRWYHHRDVVFQTGGLVYDTASDFTTSTSSSQISQSSATLFTFIVFFFFCFFFFYSTFSSYFFPTSSFTSSSFCFCHSSFLCFGLHCFPHFSRHLIILTSPIFQSISGL